MLDSCLSDMAQFTVATGTRQVLACLFREGLVLWREKSNSCIFLCGGLLIKSLLKLLLIFISVCVCVCV